ncbi:g4132 [Coccomyxa elongata]
MLPWPAFSSVDGKRLALRMGCGGDAAGTGMLSSEESKEGALHFEEVWHQSSSDRGTWCWHPASNSLDVGYLTMEGIPKQAARVQVDTCLAVPDLDGAAVTAEEEEDDGAALGNGAADVHLYDYHIAYHPSYSVPILLFRGRSRTDGTLLMWEEIMEDLPEASRELAGADDGRWTFITQQEHPVLRTPWFSLHPCETAALEGLMRGEERNTGAQLCYSDNSLLQLARCIPGPDSASQLKPVVLTGFEQLVIQL